MALDRASTWIGPMDTANSLPAEAALDRQQRIAREAELIAEARASAAAGQLVDPAEMKAWIDSIGTDHELPPPYSCR